MKKLIALTMIALFVFGLRTEAQRGNQGKKQVNDSKLQITAIKLSDEATKLLMGKIEWKSIFKVDGKGMIRPVKDYRIRYLAKEKKIVFTVRKEEIPPLTSDGMADLGGGVYLNCYSYNDCPTCRPHTAPPATCLFQCECFMEVYYPSKDVTEFETPQGNYRGSDLR